jgi:Sulfotransferase family
VPQLTVEKVEEYAAAHTQASDPQPEHFRDNLVAVVECMNEDTEWTDGGLHAVTHMLGQALRNRIEVDRYVHDVPAVDEGALVSPIFLTGLPRSGTTYFQYLFDQDPSLRMLRTWEGDRPAPPPATDPESVTSRREASIENAKRTHKAMRGAIDAMHLTDVDGPQECLAILDQTFINPGLMWTRSASSYLTFLLERADLRAAYEYHQRVLRLLQWGASSQRWVLKWPCHLLGLDAIHSVYPDAHFVVTHRDPVQALASNCSLAHMLRSSADPKADPRQTGRDMLELVRRHVDRLVEFDVAQEMAGHELLVHVDYYQLVDDPGAVMPAVFEAVGIEWTDGVDERIRSWREKNPRGKRGVHTYALEEYGLERDEVADAFSSYTQRFDIPSEYGENEAS